MSQFSEGSKRKNWSQEAEISVLSSALMDKESTEVVVEKLTEDMFHDPRNRSVMRGISKLFKSGKEVSPVALLSLVESNGSLVACGGIDYITEVMVEPYFTSAFLEQHCDIVKDMWLLRTVVDASMETIDDATKPSDKPVRQILDDAETRIMSVGDMATTDSGEWSKNLIMSAMENIDSVAQSDGGIAGVRTGFKDVDRVCSGIKRGELTIIAGRPSMGKTAMAFNVVANVAIGENLPVAVFSLEMSKEQVMERLLFGEALVNTEELRRDPQGGYARLAKAAKLVSDASIWIDDSPGVSMIEVRAKARRVQRSSGGLGLVVVDYLQLMGDDGSRRGRTRSEEVGANSRALKALAKELDVPVICVSQLSRGTEARIDKRPHLSDLRDSGEIEQDADVIGFLYRPEYYHGPVDENGDSLKGKAEFIIGKNRNGPVGVVPLMFKQEYTRFFSVSGEREWER